MTLGIGGLDQQLNNKVAAFGGMPESELTKRVKLSSGLLDALAAEKVLQQKAAAARELSLSQESSPKTIVQKNEEAILQNTQAELANRVEGTLKNKQAKRTKNMNILAGMNPRTLQAMQKKRGVPAAPVQQRQTMAQGGIVGYADGGFLDTIKEYGGKAIDYAKENPLEALSYGAMLVPGLGLVGGAGRLGLAGLRAAGMLGKGKKAAQGAGIAQRLGTKIGRDYVRPLYSAPKRAKTGPTNMFGLQKPLASGARTFSPTRTAFTTGIGGLAVDKAIKGYNAPDGMSRTGLEEGQDSITADTFLPDTEEDIADITKDKEPTISDFNQKEYDEWLTNLIGVLSAKGGRGSRGRQYYAQQQQLIDNSLKQQQVDINKQKANAADQLNRIVQDASSYEKLQGRLTAVNEEIMKIQDAVLATTLGEQLRKAKAKLAKGNADPDLIETIQLMEKAVRLEVQRQASNYGGDQTGLIAQRQALMERLEMLDNTEYDLTQTPKTVSP